MAGCRGRVPVAELRRVARHVLAAEDVAPAVEVEITLADTQTVRELNRLYRGKDEPTDVLSFATRDEEAFIASPDEAPSLGDIIVCLPVAESQAASDPTHSVAGEVAHLIVHGLLHLLAYDHEEPDDSANMQSREDDLLGALGYAGTYAHGDH